MAQPRRDAPALYELIGSRTRHAPMPRRVEEPVAPAVEPKVAPAPVRPEPADEADDRGPILGPGRAIRMPVGYFFFVAAAVIAVGVGGYLLGYQHRDAEHEEARRGAVPEPLLPITDPLNEPGVGVGGIAGVDQARPNRPGSNAGGSVQGSAAGDARASGAGRPGTAAGTANTGDPARPGIVGGPGVRDGVGFPGVTVVSRETPDPRERGLNYAVIASLGEERALLAARYLAGRGVEVVVVPGQNGRFDIVSRAGFAGGAYKERAGRSLETRIREIGRAFRQEHGGPTDFSDMWWKRFG